MAKSTDSNAVPKEGPFLQKNDLYPLADALGFRITLGPAAGVRHALRGSRKWVYRTALFEAGMETKIIDSMLCTDEVQTTAVRLSLSGHLQMVVTCDHKRGQSIEAYLIDNTQLPEDKTESLFGERWSRLKFLFAIRNAVVAHFTWVEAVKRGDSTWVETYNAKQWVADYLIAREVHKLSSNDALDVAHLLASGRLLRTAEVLANWAKSTPAHREELLTPRKEATA